MLLVHERLLEVSVLDRIYLLCSIDQVPFADLL